LTVRHLTIVVPALNEARRIEATLEKILAFATQRFDPLEVIVVDDGSIDGTAELVRKRFGAQVSVLKRPQRGGKGAAVRSGIQAAQSPWILFVDADFSIPIQEIEKLLPHTERAPIVIGSKRAPGSEIEYPPLRKLLGGMGQYLISAFVVRGFHDTQCGFKLFRADVAKQIFALQKLDGFGFDFEVLFLAKRLGHAVSEVPVRCEHQGGSTVRLKSYFKVLSEVRSVVWNRMCGRYPRR
jgi:dolichyl-phosphate beta-glucosyltransferase